MSIEAVNIDTTQSVAVQRALKARQGLNRLVHGVDTPARISTRDAYPENSGDTVIEYNSAGARRALAARRAFNRVVHGVDCSCRIETRYGKPTACSCGTATVG